MKTSIVSFRLFLALALVSCTPTASTVLEPSYQLLPVNDAYAIDSLSEAIIAPYRAQLAQQMEVVIGHADKRLEEQQVESLLGNFVSDAILNQSMAHYPGKIHLSVINNAGLRAPIPQGPIKVSHIYELMPFDNLLYILELNGSQTKSLFNLLASDKSLAIANSVVFIDNDQPTRIFIDGEPFKAENKYVLAVSDYLAHGGGGMDFLKEAHVVARIDVQIRDMIIDYIKLLEAKGNTVDAVIEGRVKLI